MKMPRFKDISLENLAAFVSDHLTRNGIQAVLTGGACVSIYTRNQYVSYDLDFVLCSPEDKRGLRQAMEMIGFRLEAGCFKHEETPLFIEFLPPPPSVGEEPVRKISMIRKKCGLLKLLSPTDCIKDRLAAYYHWNDRQSLEQALLVGRAQTFDLADVRRWSLRENMAEKFDVFRSRLSSRKRSVRADKKGKSRAVNR